MKILLACEESQAVCKQMRKRGHEAFSCDILPCSGGHPEWHIQGDVLEVITQDWDMMIAFPPCTHLAVSGAAWFEQKRKDGRQQQAIDFFMKLVNAPIDKIAIENPVGIMSKIYRKPDQVIQPYFFGDPHQKTTCLWLKNLPPLYHNAKPNLFDSVVTHVEKGEFYEWVDKKTGKKKKQPMWYAEAFIMHDKTGERGKIRSKTFPGIARAIASQWG
jgi:site-specific DNA-cytosine methylase